MDKTNIYMIVSKNTNNYKLTRSSLPLLVDSDFRLEDDRFEKISVEDYAEKYGSLFQNSHRFRSKQAGEI